MKPQSRDTSPQAEHFLIEQLRKMPAYVKARQSAELTRTCRALAMNGIRSYGLKVGQELIIPPLPTENANFVWRRSGWIGTQW